MPAHEIDVRAVVWSGAAIAAAILTVVGAVFVLLHVWHVSARTDRVRLSYDLLIEGPALQSAPQPVLAGERASKARILTTSAWVDDAHGIDRIPIATAMRLLVERSAVPASATALAPSTARPAPVHAGSAPSPATASSAPEGPR